jgi:hypothetical protein
MRGAAQAARQARSRRHRGPSARAAARAAVVAAAAAQPTRQGAFRPPGIALYSFPQMTHDVAQNVPSNKLNMIFAVCHDEDSPHGSVALSALCGPVPRDRSTVPRTMAPLRHARHRELRWASRHSELRWASLRPLLAQRPPPQALSAQARVPGPARRAAPLCHHPIAPSLPRAGGKGPKGDGGWGGEGLLHTS